MGGIIDFSTDCPWQLYVFSFLHLGAGILMYFIDICRLLGPSSTTCTGSEIVMARMATLCFLYTGVLYTAVTYHSKRSPEKITTLTNFALNGAMALLTCCIFAGNASFYQGLETSWMHKGDMLTMMLLVGILLQRVTQTNATWAQKNAMGEGLGINCKTLILFFVVTTAIKVFVYTDFIDPKVLLAEGLKMTKWGKWMWNTIAVLMIEILLALVYSLLFDDESGHEVMISAILVMTAISLCSFYTVRDNMSHWMGLNERSMWIQLGIVVVICAVALIGGRRGATQRAGYQGIGEGTTLKV